MRPESTASGRRLSWISVVVLALVPLLVVGTLLGLARRPADGPVQAAIVNLDEAVTIEVDGAEREVPLAEIDKAVVQVEMNRSFEDEEEN